MKPFLLATFFLLPFFATAQIYRYYFDNNLNPASEKKATITATGTNTGAGVFVAFYRIKDNKLVGRTLFNDPQLSMRTGVNEEYYDNGAIALINNYKADKLHGLSQLWDTQGRMIDSSVYENGKVILSKKITFFEELKIQECIENIRNNTLHAVHFDTLGKLFSKADFKGQVGTVTYYIEGRAVSQETVNTREEKKAAFPGSEKKWHDFLDRHLDIDIIKKQGGYGLQDKVLIRFTVETDGTISNIRPLSHVGFGTEQEVIRVLKKSPNWIPGYRYGKPVITNIKQAVMISTPLF